MTAVTLQTLTVSTKRRKANSFAFRCAEGNFEGYHIPKHASFEQLETMLGMCDDFLHPNHPSADCYHSMCVAIRTKIAVKLRKALRSTTSYDRLTQLFPIACIETGTKPWKNESDLLAEVRDELFVKLDDVTRKRCRRAVRLKTAAGVFRYIKGYPKHSEMNRAIDHFWLLAEYELNNAETLTDACKTFTLISEYFSSINQKWCFEKIDRYEILYNRRIHALIDSENDPNTLLQMYGQMPEISQVISKSNKRYPFYSGRAKIRKRLTELV